MIIGTVYKSREFNELVVNNIPYKKHDHPCWEGCCDNELTVSLRDLSRSGWLLRYYMPNNNITVFDYNDWSSELDESYKKHRLSRAVIKTSNSDV